MTKSGRCCGALLAGLQFFLLGCPAPPPKEGFTDIALSNSRQALETAPGSSKSAHWDSLELTLLDRPDVILARLSDVRVLLQPEHDAGGALQCRASFTATLQPEGWCS